MNDKELDEYQNQLLGELKDVLSQSGFSTEGLDDLVNMTDEEIMQWLEEAGLDASMFAMDD